MQMNKADVGVCSGFVFVQDCGGSTDFSVSAHYPDRLWHHQTADGAASLASEQMWSDSVIFSVYFIPVMSFSILNICATKAAILRSNKAFCLIRMQAADALTCPLSCLPHPTSNAPLIIWASETHFPLTLEPQNWILVNQHLAKETAPIPMHTFLPCCHNTESRMRAVVRFSLLLCPRTLQHCHQPSGISVLSLVDSCLSGTKPSHSRDAHNKLLTWKM